MKFWSTISLGLLFALTAATSLAQQPLAGVAITAITGTPVAVTSGSGGTVNESSAPYTDKITITAKATGGTDPRTFTIYVNGQPITTLSGGSTGTATWTPPQPGSYFLSASVSDGTGTTATSLAVRYFAVGTVVNSPVTGTLVPQGSTVVIKADATAAGGIIKQIQFFDNGTAIGTDTTAPYSLIYTVPGAAGSTHSITAQATDNNGTLLPLSAAVTLNVITAITPLPTVSISSPANNAPIAIGGSIPVSVNASNSSGRIAKVELYIDGQLFETKTAFPYSFTDWTPTVVGNYVLVALAYDDKSNVIASTPITVVVAAPPTVTVTNPTSSSTVTGGTPTQIRATASDSSGNSITSVQFFVDTVFVGQATTPVTGTTNTYQITATLTQHIDPTTGAVVPSVITALATNSAGLSGVSPGVSVNVTNGGGGGGGGTTTIGNPPTVSITSPTAATSLQVNAATPITANATDSDGNITSVQFFVNNTSIGSSTVYPYSVSWTPTSLGSYALTAKATDNDGNVVTSSAVTVSVVDRTPNAPTVLVTSPANGATLPVNTAQTLTASASDLGSIASVQFFVNGQPLGGAITKFPYSTSWTPTSPGAYQIAARAINASGIQATSTTITVTVTGGTPPTVSLTAPASATTMLLGNTTVLNANAVANGGATISNVSFLANGTPIGAPLTKYPYNLAFTPTAPGTYTITAVATDSFGNQTTSPAVNLTVAAGSTSAPVVSLTSPANGTTMTVNTTTLVSANAMDPDGVVTQVEFFANGLSLGTKATAPYFTVWTPTSAGTYTITAVATDDAGNRTTSAASSVTITAASGTWPVAALSFNDPHIDTPTAGSTSTTSTSSALTPVKVDYGSKLIIEATALSTSATIAKVQFFANGTSIGTVAAAPFFVTWPLNTLDNVVLTAIATDSNGNSVPTNPILIATQPSAITASDQVTLVSPVNGATYVTGRQITFSATHNYGNVTPPKIDFYLNGNQFTTVTTAPYVATLGITRPGVYIVHAVGRLGDSTTVSNPAQITVLPNNAPTISITSPAGGNSFTVATTVPISATASDSDGTIKSVQFFVNGIALATKNTAPYTATWNPGAAGTYILTALATDDSDTQTMSAPVSVTIIGDVAPTAAVTAPSDGTRMVAGTPVTLSANASDSDGTVTGVKFLANGVVVGTASAAPYSVTWTPVTSGTYSVVAQATDNAGNVTNSSPISVTVVANQAPAVAVTAPGTGATVRVGSTAVVSASASDADGTIASVQFFANGTPIASAVTAPSSSGDYRVQWSPLAQGIYRLTAVATDNAGATTTSSAITVLAVPATGGEIIYTGNYAGSGEVGRFAAIKSAAGANFIGFSTTPAGKVYFFPGLTVDAAGGFSATDATGRSLVAGAANDTGVSGTLDNGRLTFIGPITFSNGTSTITPGYYVGSLAGRSASTIAAIVAADGSVTVYITDGTFQDAGAGSIGANGSFTVTTTNGNRITGAIDPATSFLTGTLVGGPAGTFSGALESGVTFSDGYLRNLSTRGQVGTGANILIAGFVVGGNTPKRVLIRAIGPTLSSFGVSGALADPQLDLFNGSAKIASNDNWAGAADLATAMTQAGAFALPATSLDAVILTTLAPGSYTAQVSGVGGRTGVALVELYDMDNLQPFSSQKVLNIATRGAVGAGQGQLIAGFVVSGNTPKKVLIRAVGPTLGAAPFNVTGTLADPYLRLYRSANGTNTVVRENDNWQTGNDPTAVADAAARAGAFALPAGSKDAAILISLPPGVYSAEATGVNSTTGVALIEVYEVP